MTVVKFSPRSEIDEQFIILERQRQTIREQKRQIERKTDERKLR